MLAQRGRAGKGPRKPLMSHEHLCPQGHPATAAREREQPGGPRPGVFVPEEAQGLLSSTGSFLEHRSHRRAGATSSPVSPC